MLLGLIVADSLYFSARFIAWAWGIEDPLRLCPPFEPLAIYNLATIALTAYDASGD
jgi:hypothetical protein